VDNPYFEKNNTTRFSTQFQLNHEIKDHINSEIKNSISFYDRTISIPDFTFAGEQISSFSEINFSFFKSESESILGLNLWTEKFNHSDAPPNRDLSSSSATIGVFGQNIWNINEYWTLETGIRADYQTNYGFFPLPRFSLMVEPTGALTLRLGGGLGYKTPTVFSEEAERLHFQNILPIDPETLEAERSYGSNFDINYRLAVTDELILTANTLFFYTQIQNPLMLEQSGNLYAFQQLQGYVDTKGVEVNIKWSYNDLKLFMGYTFADVNQHDHGESTAFPLVAKHRLNNVLMYEKHENFWVGLEAYFFSPQKLGDGAIGQSYWIVGLMTEKKLGEHFSLFLNFENFTDTRQTAFDTIYTGDITNPQFRDIYAPVDGFVINGGVKMKW
jgi:outer membrane receptor for ferrienterochelin and colicins